MMKLQELKGHDVYEFSYAENGLNNWNQNSLFLSTEDFSLLSTYLDKVFDDYNYYGPQKVKLEDWKKVKKVYELSKETHESITKFFIEIDKWLENKNDLYDYFWILGV
ncbi:hypothetical protein M2651_14130 [Clostridium sp. SYSU_GA19001]|nr:hypothetical protein [Clostridium caldaquaticum]